MSQRNIQQQRAAFALTQVLEVKTKQSDDVAKRFKAYSNSLPAMVQMNGIGQALAFAYQKSKPGDEKGRKPENIAWNCLFKLVEQWLLIQSKIWGNKENLMLALTQGNQEQYQLAHAELQALLGWVKDFARAEIAGEADQGE